MLSGDALEGTVAAAERSWEVSPYQAGDEGVICDAMRRATDVGLSAEAHLRQWRWRFLDNPYGRVWIDLAWHGDVLVGQYAVMPVRMTVDGAQRWWAISLDTFTNPDYRRQGVFGTLAKSLYGRLADQADVVYGFPNENSSYGFYNKLRWIPVTPHPRLVLPGVLPAGLRRRHPAVRTLAPAADAVLGVAVRGLSAVSRAVGWTRGVRTEVSEALPDDLEPLWAAVAPQAGIRVTADRAWFTWRYVRHPDFQYRFVSARRGDALVGMAVVRPPPPDGRSRMGQLMDVLLADPDDADAARALVGASVEASCAGGGPAMSALAPVGSTLRRALLSAGFVPHRDVKPQWTWTLGARMLHDRVSPAQVVDGARWFVGFGVHDAV
jgi:GNAT superfamily N-acetyltransferase